MSLKEFAAFERKVLDAIIFSDDRNDVRKIFREERAHRAKLRRNAALYIKPKLNKRTKGKSKVR